MAVGTCQLCGEQVEWSRGPLKWCKSCKVLIRRTKIQQQYADDKDKHLIYNQLWRLENREACLGYKRKYNSKPEVKARRKQG